MGDRRAVICGYYGKGNGGDEALLVSLLQMLPEEVKPIVLSHDPVRTSKLYGVTSYQHKSLLPILKALRQSDFFLWGGGSLMQDVTSIASPIYYGCLMLLAKLLGLKTIAWAQGIGPLNHPLTRWLTKTALRGCSAVSVRDKASAKLLRSWKIQPTIAPDPVWALASKPVKGLWNTRAPRIAVTLRPHSQLTPQRLQNLTQALIDLQTATQACILLVPFQPSFDTQIARSIADKLPGEHQIITLEDPRELKGLFRGVEMVIGMRFHSLIMAAAEGCRCFALSYDPKVSQLMQQLDLPGWKLSEMPDNSRLISKTWLELYANEQPLSVDRVQFLVDRALMHRELLKDTLQ
jgi:polysaccharide pyruvyl transferase CsaB